ncbi:TRIM46 [Mytilus edulis]|uniref:TRIM46 n=1 Tax=Mytilus edulis TaxID=6550 RepID=A0A8S3UQB2_MYTED|nr:TRIM46 [Mytilus edulis]
MKKVKSSYKKDNLNSFLTSAKECCSLSEQLINRNSKRSFLNVHQTVEAHMKRYLNTPVEKSTCGEKDSEENMIDFDDHLRLFERNVEILENDVGDGFNEPLIEPAKVSGLKFETDLESPFACRSADNQSVSTKPFANMLCGSRRTLYKYEGVFANTSFVFGKESSIEILIRFQLVQQQNEQKYDKLTVFEFGLREDSISSELLFPSFLSVTAFPCSNTFGVCLLSGNGILLANKDILERKPNSSIVEGQFSINYQPSDSLFSIRAKYPKSNTTTELHRAQVFDFRIPVWAVFAAYNSDKFNVSMTITTHEVGFNRSFGSKCFQKCCICGNTSDITYNCQHCNINLCEICRCPHEKENKTHNLIVNKPTTFREEDDNLDVCQNLHHERAKLRYFCNSSNCQIVLCPLCVIAEHRDISKHELEDIDEAFEKEKRIGK